jgi:hypothetical protein
MTTSIAAFSKDYEGVDYEHFWAGPGKRYLDGRWELCRMRSLRFRHIRGLNRLAGRCL